MMELPNGRVRVSFISKTKFYETCLTRRLIQSQELSSLKPVRGPPNNKRSDLILNAVIK